MPQSSQASTWPPSAAVRHATIAPITRRCDPTEMTGMYTAIGVAMPAQNIGNLDGGPVAAARRADHHPHPAADHLGGVDLQRQAIERALRRPDRIGGDLRVARCRRQTIVPEQDLDDPDIGSVLEKMRREAVAQRVERDALGQARSLHRRPTGGVQHGLIDRMIFVTTREQIKSRPGEPPVGAQDAQQLGRQHHVAILRALAVAHLDELRALSMSSIRSPATSEALSPAA